MYIIMLGKPGSGKGTVGSVLKNKTKLLHLSSGDLFRNYIKNAGEIGKEIESYISKGNLVPDTLAIKLVEQRLLEDDCKDGVILDGFPRSIEQAKELDVFLENKGKKIDIVANLELSDEDIIKRITNRIVCPNCGLSYNTEFKKPKKSGYCDACGSKLEKRHDDNIETIKTRLQNYRNTTEKLVDYYLNKGVLKTIKVDINDNSDRIANEIIND